MLKNTTSKYEYPEIEIETITVRSTLIRAFELFKKCRYKETNKIRGGLCLHETKKYAQRGTTYPIRRVLTM